jgi:hypothetical protein
MNLLPILMSIITTSVPALLQLLNDPNFQALVKAIEANFNQAIASGVPAATATQHATGLLGSAAMLHLTGNPVADFNSWIASMKPPVATPTKTGTFTS